MPYDKCGIYSLSCVTCNEEYVGQARHRLNLRFKEHECYIKYNNPQSAHALHILNNQQECGPIDKTMTFLKPIQNISLLTPYEHFFMQSLHKSCKTHFRTNPL